MKVEIKCPNCGKLLAKKEEGIYINGIYLYCKLCKKEIEYKEEPNCKDSLLEPNN